MFIQSRRIVLLCLLLTLPILLGCQKVTPLEDVSHFVEEVETMDAPNVDFAGVSQLALDPSSGILALEKIVNTGEKLWNIVEKNRASTKAPILFANALPKGATEGSELDGFSDLQKRSYRAYGKNLYGVTVYEFEYTLLHRYGGTYRGAGKFLDHVAVVPTNVMALWGYTVDVNVACSTPSNVGTQSAPVGALVVQVNLSVSTVLKSVQSTRAFEFRGDSFSANEVTGTGSQVALVR